MARAKEAHPAGDRERDLLELVETRFDHNVTKFSRAVAERTKKTPATEKKAFYRIIAGEPGTLVPWRLKHYARVLNISPGPFVAAWEEDGGADGDGVLPARLGPGELRAVLLTLIGRIDRLVDRVEDLERQAPAKRRRGGTN